MYKWECSFESTLKLDAAPSLETLNAWALDHSIWFNSTRVHSRTRTTRFETWCGHIASVLEPPDYEIYQNLCASPPEKRRVRNDGTFSYTPSFNMGTRSASNTYRVPDLSLFGREITVAVNYYEYPAVRVTAAGIDQPILCEPIPVVDGGFLATAAIIGETYRSPGYTDTQRNLAAIDAAQPTVARQVEQRQIRAQLAAPTAADAPPAGSIRVHGIGIANTPNVLHRPAVTTIHDTPAAAPAIGRIEAKLRILNLLNTDFEDLTPEQQSAINALPETVPVAQLAALAESVHAATNTTPREISQ